MAQRRDNAGILTIDCADDADFTDKKTPAVFGGRFNISPPAASRWLAIRSSYDSPYRATEDE